MVMSIGCNGFRIARFGEKGVILESVGNHSRKTDLVEIVNTPLMEVKGDMAPQRACKALSRIDGDGDSFVEIWNLM